MTIDYTQPRIPPSPSEQRSQKSWFRRNWGWVVALGCLSPLLLAGGCVAALVFTVFSAIRATDVYEDAIVRAQNDPRVIAELGRPVKVGWWMTGNVSLDGDRGTADFSLPLNGSRNRAMLQVEARRDGGGWDYSVLRVQVRNGGVIDLAPPLSSSPAGSTNTTPPDDRSADPSNTP